MVHLQPFPDLHRRSAGRCFPQHHCVRGRRRPSGGGSLWRLAVASLAKRKGPYGRCSGNGKRVIGRVHGRSARSLKPRGTRRSGLEPAVGPRCVERVEGRISGHCRGGTASAGRSPPILGFGRRVRGDAHHRHPARLGVVVGRWGSASGARGTWLIHVQHDASTSASLEGISYTFQGSGFDLGLIPSEDRAAAIESAPSAENTSRLAWEGEARWDLPVWQQDLVLWAGVAWFALPMVLGVLSRASIDAPRALFASGATEEE